MKRILIFFLSFILISCSQPTEKKKQGATTLYGGVLKICEYSDYNELFPLQIGEAVEHRIADNIYEGLVSFDHHTLAIKPRLAKSWSVSKDGLEYTFVLRDSVFFHQDKCFGKAKRQLKAADFLYTFQLMLDGRAPSEGYSFFIDHVKGARDYFEQTKLGKSGATLQGISAIAEDTLKIQLSQPFADFLGLLALPYAYAIPKEAVDYYGIKGLTDHAVGTGPFSLFKVLKGQTIILRKNPDYWMKDKDGKQLPYLDAINISIIGDQKTAFLDFLQGNLDMIYQLSPDIVEEIFDEKLQLKSKYQMFQAQITPQMDIEYYGFLHTAPPFDNVNFRKALCYAIDKDKIIKYVNKGLAHSNINGVVPPTLQAATGYNVSSVRGYAYNPTLAKKHLALSGFDPKAHQSPLQLQVNISGGKNIKIAEAVIKQIKNNLNIDIEYIPLQKGEHYENVSRAKTKFWRAGWKADYPSPEIFLRLWYAKDLPPITEKSYLNTTRYNNPVFDALFEKGMSTTNDSLRNMYYQQADQILMDDAVVLPLYTTKEIRLLQPYLREMPANAIEFRDFREVFLTK